VYLDFFTTKSSYFLIVDFAEELTLSVDLFHGSRSDFKVDMFTSYAALSSQARGGTPSGLGRF
jgi:hypothetical protein